MVNLKPAHLLFQYLNLMQFDIHKALMHTKLKHLSSSIKRRWLDIGAGDQPYKQYFANASEYLTTNTKRHYSTAGFELLEKQTTYWIEDGKTLPVSDNSLDGVACFQVLSVIDEPADFFHEISRVLRPGGKLILTSDFLYPVWSSEDRFRHTAFNLKQLAEANGFTVTASESFGGFGSTTYALFMRFMRSFPEIWRCKKIIAKIVSALMYLLLLMLLPILSLLGLAIFVLEKNSITNTDFTFNILLTAEKK